MILGIYVFVLTNISGRFVYVFLNNEKSGMPRMFPGLEQHQQHQSNRQHLGHFSCITVSM